MTRIDNGTIQYRDELFRKLIHLFSLSIPIVYYFITTKAAAIILGILAVLALIIDLGRYLHLETGKIFYKIFGFLLREHELGHKKKNLNGATYVLISALISVLIFPKVISISAFSILIISDSAAALIGRKFGKHKFLSKSLEGTLTFFISACIVILFTMDAHHLYNRPGGGIYSLSPVRPDGRVRPVVESLGEGIYRDICLHWDGGRLLFSFGNGSDAWDGRQSYHLYEVGVDGRGLRQLTFGPKNDCEPFYLPGGQIGLTSDRPEHFVMCGGDRHVANLHVMEADGSGLRQLSYNVFNEFNPAVLPDGRILYSRWEYNERSVTSLHNPFTMRPPGSPPCPRSSC